MRVSILTPKAFSMRRAMSPDRSALRFKRLERAKDVKPGGPRGRRDGEARRVDDFSANEITRMGSIIHGHTFNSFLLVLIL